MRSLQFEMVLCRICRHDLLAAIALILLGGCASYGPPFQPATIPQDQGILYVYRPSTLLSAAVSWGMRVDDRDVGRIANGGYLVVPLDPGQHTITTASIPVEINVDAGVSIYARFVPTGTNGVSVQIVDERIALPEISKLRILK